MPAGDAGGDLGGDEGGGEESTLLAVPPGSRNEPRLTPGAKGKVYYPKKVDRRKAGARTRSNAAKYNREKGSAAMRNVVPGMSDIQSLTQMNGLTSGIYEHDMSIYNEDESREEAKLFQINESIRDLIKGLESVEHKDES
jgi:hypothetical protein